MPSCRRPLQTALASCSAGILLNCGIRVRDGHVAFYRHPAPIRLSVQASDADNWQEPLQATGATVRRR